MLMGQTNLGFQCGYWSGDLDCASPAGTKCCATESSPLNSRELANRRCFVDFLGCSLSTESFVSSILAPRLLPDFFVRRVIRSVGFRERQSVFGLRNDGVILPLLDSVLQLKGLIVGFASVS